MSKRKIFSREFKLEALRALDSGKKQATELARELGIPRSRLYAWRQQLQAGGKSDAFPSELKGDRFISPIRLRSKIGLECAEESQGLPGHPPISG